MASLKLDWIECTGGWCPLFHLNMEKVSGRGVYVIWQPGYQNSNVIYVGQGDIKARLQAHCGDLNIVQHDKVNSKDLLVTWAEVGSGNRDGVERYLADKLSPREGEQHPDVTPIAVNLPSSK